MKENIGRKWKLSDRDHRTVRKGHKNTVPKITAELNVHLENQIPSKSVRRELHEARFYGKAAIRKTYNFFLKFPVVLIILSNLVTLGMGKNCQTIDFFLHQLENTTSCHLVFETCPQESFIINFKVSWIFLLSRFLVFFLFCFLVCLYFSRTRRHLFISLSANYYHDPTTQHLSK